MIYGLDGEAKQSGCRPESTARVAVDLQALGRPFSVGRLLMLAMGALEFWTIFPGTECPPSSIEEAVRRGRCSASDDAAQHVSSSGSQDVSVCVGDQSSFLWLTIHTLFLLLHV